jgi:hypothetical protein
MEENKVTAASILEKATTLKGAAEERLLAASWLEELREPSDWRKYVRFRDVYMASSPFLEHSTPSEACIETI